MGLIFCGSSLLENMNRIVKYCHAAAVGRCVNTTLDIAKSKLSFIGGRVTGQRYALQMTGASLQVSKVRRRSL